MAVYADGTEVAVRDMIQHRSGVGPIRMVLTILDDSGSWHGEDIIVIDREGKDMLCMSRYYKVVRDEQA